MKTSFNKILALVLTVLMLMTLMPIQALASYVVYSVAVGTLPVYTKDAGTSVQDLVGSSTNNLTIPQYTWEYDGYLYIAVAMKTATDILTFQLNGVNADYNTEMWVSGTELENLNIDGVLFSPNVFGGGGSNSHWGIAKFDKNAIGDTGSYSLYVQTNLGGGHDLGSPTDPVVFTNLMTIRKTADVSEFSLGTVIQYTVVLTNMGDQDLSSVNISDSLAGISVMTIVESNPSTPGVMDAKPGNAATGETWTITYTYEATQADVDRGYITNTATASSNRTDPVSSSVTIDALQLGTLTVKKEVSGPMLNPSITFPIAVTINGNVTNINLANGESMDFPNVAFGSTYSVSETAPTGYTVSYTNGSGTIASAAVLATVTNTSQTATLTVKKEVSGSLFDPSQTFSIAVTINGVVTNISLMNGESADFTDLPFGSTYSVSETAPTGFTPSYVNGSGTILGTAVLATVTNTYAATGSFNVDATLDPTKVLAGRVLTDGEFEFVLKQGANILQTVNNTADGNIPFLPINYTQDDIGQTYEYTITETTGSETGMTYDSMVLTFSVTISDLGGGLLSATLDSQPADTIFNNSYEANGSYDVDANLNPTKVLAGRVLTDGEFEFVLKQDGNTLQTVNNTADGNIPFLPINYTQADIGQTYEYTITETAGSETGMTYDSMVLTFSVTVSDLGNGILSAVLDSQPADTIFNNSYEANGSYDVDANLNPTKVLAGRVLTDGEFEFVLKQDGNTLQTVNNTADGNIPFAALNYTQADIGQTYEYTITETTGSETGMTYDSMVLTFSVIVTDLGNGLLSAVLDDSSNDTIFNNSYAASGSYDVDANLNPTKVLAGRVLTDGEFEFVLKQGANILQTVNNTADGNIPFLPINYTQDDIGQTYEYTITETTGSETGMTYDSMVLTFSVTISDLGGGLLSATLDSQPADTIFNNSYEANGSYDVDANLNPTKVLAGRVLTDGEFEFVLKQDGNTLQTVNNTADGNIPFLPINYTQADIGQTYEYTITETAGSETGMTYDSMVLTFSVTVSDLGNGILSAVLDSQPADTIFNNSYEANGSYDVDANLNPTKVLAGRVLTDGEFEFVLRKDSNVIQTVNNTADGNIPFLPLEFTQDDIGKTYIYSITETSGSETGMTYDFKTILFMINVTDLGNGALNATLLFVVPNTTFENSYTARGSYDVDLGLNPTKLLEGRDLTDGEFTFVLKEGANVLQTVNNTADGNIPFLPINYTQDDIGQTYEYTITETAGSETGMTYDSMVLTFSVTVSDLGNGVLSAVLDSQPADTIFNNSYEASGSYDVDADFNPTKILTGRTLTDGEYEFVLKMGSDVLQTVSNTADGNIPFLPINYTQDDIGQTYEYTISEVIPVPGETGMTYDSEIATFSVSVSDLGNGVLSAVLTGTNEKTEFYNSYEASGSYDVDLSLNPTKVLAGRVLAAGEFTFELWQDGSVLQTAANEADGNIPFLPLDYTQADIGQTYEYTINEVIPVPGETGMTYDSMVLAFSVTVTDLGNGVLGAALATQPADTIFNNSAPLTRYSIFYYYRLSPDDPYVLNPGYNYTSPLVAVGSQAGAFADRSENGFWQLVGSTGNGRVLVINEAENIVNVYYQPAQVPLGGGAVINVGDASE